jgi:general stress protein YciG
MAEAQHSGNPGNFAEDREKAARAGHVGGQHSSGNFANDRERAAEAGRKGGQASHGGASAGGAEHRPGNFAEDREKGPRRVAREADRKS